MTQSPDILPSSGAPPGLSPQLHASVDEAILSASADMTAFRRDLHAHPEPSGDEHRTTQLLHTRLKEQDFQLHTLPATGVVADLHLGAPDDSWLAIRADIDCVPISDLKSVAWASTRAGCCHACGHDAHTTMVLYAAETLSNHRKYLAALHPAANLRFVFQPAEETATGATSFIDAGVVNDVRAMVALHCDPYLNVGQIGLRNGPITSHMTTFHIQVSGKGGHSARPHEVIDPIPAATNLIGMLYQLAPRSMDSRYPMCLTVTSITAGEAYNAIPNEAVICGTLRSGRREDQDRVKKAMARCVRGMCEATGCTAELTFPYAAPATNNHREATTLIEEAAAHIGQAVEVIRLPLPSLGGEDFAYYQQHIPASMARLGTGTGPLDARRPLHSPCFDIDESALPIGARLLAHTALCGLAKLRT